MCFAYDEVALVSSQRRVVVRKLHHCEGCGETIRRGKKALYESGLTDSGWWSRYTCQACERIILSIAAEELTSGCGWHEAWCSPDDLRDYLADRREPVKLLGFRTVEECQSYVEALSLRGTRFVNPAMESELS